MEKKKIKVLFIGDQVTPTGFSRVLHNIINNLSNDEYRKVALGVNYWGDPHDEDYPIYPAPTATSGDIYGYSRLLAICEKEKPDIIFILNDAWVIDDYLIYLKKVYKENFTPPKIVVYFPVDAREHDPDWYQNFDAVARMVTYTKFGKEVADKALDLFNTPRPFGDVRIIPHGVDTNVFHKLEENKSVIRQIMFPRRLDIAESPFIVLNANRNQQRKRNEVTMEGFKLFAEGKPKNIYLYMHCGVTDSHIDIIKMAMRYNIGPQLLLTSKTTGVQNVSLDKLNKIYNCCDVGINTGIGEGWGLCNMEHAVTGAPQVVADHSALHEIYEDCGILIPTISDFLLSDIMTVGKLVRAEDVATCLDMLYTNTELYQSLSKKSIQKFICPDYSWVTIGKQWDNLFKEIL